MKGGFMQFKHLRSKLIEAKKDVAGRMSLTYGSQRQDKLALDPGEKEMSRLNPLRKDLNPAPKDTSKVPDNIKTDVPDFIQQDRDAAEKLKIDNERARQNYSAGVSATDAAFKEIDRQEKQKYKQDIQGHSTNKGRGWEGKVGK
jgi:hypothetical protein